MEQHTGTKTIDTGKLVFDTADTTRTWEAQDNDAALRAGYKLEAGQQLIVDPFSGWRFIVSFTGRTRRQWGMACPTLDRFHIDTVADEDGVVWGVAGERCKGTVATRPDNVTVR